MYLKFTRSLVLLILLSTICIAQDLTKNRSWDKIESAIQKKKNLIEVEKEIKLLSLQAIKADNNVDYARLLYYSMLIKDQRTEDSLYFRNSAIIDSLLLNPKSPIKLKSILHVIQAKRIKGFQNKYPKFKRDRYETPDLKNNYAAYTQEELDSLIHAHFQEALVGAKSFTIDNDNILWLSSYTNVFLFKPSFYDLVCAEDIGYATENQNGETLTVEQVGKWIDLPSKDLNQLLDSLDQTKQQKYTVLKNYHIWLNNNKRDTDKAAFIETLVRKYLYITSSYDSLIQNKYQILLRNGITSSFAMVKAHSIFQLCGILNEQGNRYQYDFEDIYRKQQSEALKIYQDNRALINSYPSLKVGMFDMERQILAPALCVTLADHQVPDSSIQLHIKYKNVPKVYYRLIKVNALEEGFLQGFDNDKQKQKREMLLMPIFSEGELDLPLPTDYNHHAIFLKLNALKTGNYNLLFSDKPITGLDFDFVDFDVNSITPVKQNDKLFILDRQSGQPIKGAAGIIHYRISKIIDGKRSNTEVVKQTLADKDGVFLIDKEKSGYVIIAYKGDTVKYNFWSAGTEADLAIFNKEKFDDLYDFHDEYARLHIFTDRGIYKPGQTVFYKAILLTRNPKTGEAEIFNKKNLKSGNFAKKWLKENEPELRLLDPLNRKVDSVKIHIDDFGAFSGSFTLPKSASTGEWNIEPDYIENDRVNFGTFQVEEYKRPTIELTLEKPKEVLFPGKPIMMKLTAKAFSGAILNNTAVKVSIKRGGSVPESATFGRWKYDEVILLDSTMFTNDAGEIVIAIDDKELKSYQFPSGKVLTFLYSCDFTVTDNTGESVRLTERLNVSTLPINVNVQLDRVYDRQALSAIAVSTNAELVGPIKSVVKFQIYKLPTPVVSIGNGLKVDQGKKTIASALLSKKELVYETTINTDSNEKLQIPQEKMTAGSYEINGFVEQEGRLVGKSINHFDVFDSELNEVPDYSKPFSYVRFNQVKPGDKIKFYTGADHDTYSIYEIQYFSKSRNSLSIKHLYQVRQQNKGLQQFEFQIPGDAIDQLLVTKVWVLNNQIYKSHQTLYITGKVSSTPEITVANYRRVLIPGAKQTFSVSIKTKNQHIAAQLMSVMYDASLDKLQQHKWSIPEIGREFNAIPIVWPDDISSLRSSNLINERTFLSQNMEMSRMLSGRLAGISIGENANMALNEVVVVGYGKQKGRPGATTTIQIRGLASLADYKQPLVILDGTVYTGNLNEIHSATVSEVMMLKDAEAVQLYGEKAAGGVLIISTKGPIKLPEPKVESVVKIRKNFNETAFFFPKIYADKNGYYTMNFTMPESVTEWNWKMLAHTKDTRFAYTERKVFTQLKLMVQPNSPRLLYQGDIINLQSRITNLDSVGVNGEITCTVEDALTGEDLTKAVVAVQNNQFSITKNANTASAFSIKVPVKQINPLKIVIKASTPTFSDAEEHIIPVMSTRIFVKQSVPVQLKAEPLNIKSLKLPLDAEMFGIALTIDDKPQATLVNALPWLANFTFDCAEQTFNKLLANQTAVDLMRTDKYAQSAFRLAKRTIQDQKPENEKLPAEIDAMELPWLQLGQKTYRQQVQLFNLLDTIKTNAKIDTYLKKLYNLQNADGGISWFEGGRSDQYISAYILAGFGKLSASGWKPASNLQVQHHTFITRLIDHCDSQYIKTNSIIGHNSSLFGLYARGFWIGESKLSQSSVVSVIDYLTKQWNKVEQLSLHDQALLLLNTQRYTNAGNPLRQNVIKHIESLRQLAIVDSEHGIRWKNISDSDDLNNSTEETVALLSEAFNIEGTNQTLNTGLLKWLLSTRNEHNWVTTKATAAAIELLKKEKQTVIDTTKTMEINFGGKSLSVTDDLLNGSSFSFSRIKEQPENITFSGTAGQNTTGALTWYYFSSTINQDSLNQQIKLKKQFYRQNAAKGWIPIIAGEILKIGTQVKVVLTVQTPKMLKYIFIDEKRAAAFEPLVTNSGYEYGKDLRYYRSIRDTGLQIFAESITSGKSEITYELIVAQEGAFYSAPSVLQGMYQPAINAYSNSTIINTQQ